MSKTQRRLGILGFRVVAAAFGAGGLADLADAADLGDVHDALGNLGDVPHPVNVLDVAVPDLAAVHEVASLTEVSGIHPIVGDSPFTGDIFGSPVRDAFGRITGVAGPLSGSTMPLDAIPAGDSGLAGLGYDVSALHPTGQADELEWHKEPGSNRWHYYDSVSGAETPLRPGTNADFGGVYGGLPTDQYGNGPRNVQGGNPWTTVHGGTPTDIQGNPWTSFPKPT